MKRICMFLDGTWNEPTSNTNVWRMKLLVSPLDDEGIEQKVFYHEGVGTGIFQSVLGGVFAFGLSEYIQTAYQWLMEHYDDGDEIYIFGFSRGAFMARSLVGLIATCGLLTPGAPMPTAQVYARYQRSSTSGKDKSEIPLYELRYKLGKNLIKLDELDLEDRWLLQYSRRVPIHFMGLWDTVGALGLPIGNIPNISTSTLGWHNVRLSNIVKRGVHALALDEHRKPFAPTLWNEFIPKKLVSETKADSPTASESEKFSMIEQRWFVGAHSNVGGGYLHDELAQVPLHWMMTEANAVGLHLRAELALRGEEHLAPIRDSLAEFVGGYAAYIPKFGAPLYRPLYPQPDVKEKGIVEPVRVVVDKTVIHRYQSDKTYRPANLVEWAESLGLDLDSVDVAAHWCHNGEPIVAPVSA